jgi:hypothetical protein
MQKKTMYLEFTSLRMLLYIGAMWRHNAPKHRNGLAYSSQAFPTKMKVSRYPSEHLGVVT